MVASFFISIYGREQFVLHSINYNELDARQYRGLFLLKRKINLVK